MKKRKLLTWIMAGCMVMGLTACGSGSSAEDSQVSTTDVAEKDADTNVEPVKEAELNIMMSFPQYMDQWETYCRQFEEKMLAEENIKVKVNLEMPSSDQYESVLQARLTGDDAPDLYTLHSNNIETYYKAGNLTDLSNEELAGKIYDSVKNTVTVDGKLLAVPIESQAWGVLYNKDIFDACNIKVPGTLDELEQVCEDLEQNTIYVSISGTMGTTVDDGFNHRRKGIRRSYGLVRQNV